MAVPVESVGTDLDEIICACVDMKRTDLAAILAENPAVSFEDLMQKTGAGGKCTACLLDLEYFFTTLPRGVAPQPYLRKPKAAARSLKQQVYGLLDELSPPAPMRLVEWMPVPVVPGLAVTIWLANRPLPDGGGRCAPPLDLELTVRDGAGRIRHRGSHHLAPDSDLRAEVAHHLADDIRQGDLAAGSVEIQRHYHRTGVRGTTRPQIEFLGPEGSSSVHSQRPSPNGGGFFTHLCRPQDERLFLSVVNPGRRELLGSFGSTLADSPATEVAPGRAISVPPGGTGIYELKLSGDPALADRICTLRWSVDGISNVHLLCASPSLGVFSIDHI